MWDPPISNSLFIFFISLLSHQLIFSCSPHRAHRAAAPHREVRRMMARTAPHREGPHRGWRVCRGQLGRRLLRTSRTSLVAPTIGLERRRAGLAYGVGGHGRGGSDTPRGVRRRAWLVVAVAATMGDGCALDWVVASDGEQPRGCSHDVAATAKTWASRVANGLRPAMVESRGRRCDNYAGPHSIGGDATLPSFERSVFWWPPIKGRVIGRLLEKKK